MSTARKVAIAVGCFAVAGALLALSLSRGRRGDPVAPQAWICEDDGTTFTAPITVPPRTCPSCGKRTGVLRFTFRCQQCGTTFEAGRMKLAPDAEKRFAAVPAERRDALPMNWELPTLTRKPGTEQWAPEPITPVCPSCGNRDRGSLHQLTP